MIRPATLADVPAIVRMTFALHVSIGGRLPLDAGMVAAFAASLVTRADALALVVDGSAGPSGMLCASIERLPLSPVPVACEHGWYCAREARGQGRALLDAYLAWARDQGAWGARMSTPPAPGMTGALVKRGFVAAETAWLMVF
jgi:GNAT superfamily N-acetyltransferase